MITNMADQQAAEQRALELAQQVADLLNEIEALDAGPVRVANGRMTVPGGYVRHNGEWEVSAD
ncbi:hypothetical protein [Streptomyces rubiginosohelvolus]|uniref:hypothetical protein n=1 Tax=Streptomyces rubiginosohelvolus TaxID=67362 RepID=UPI0033E1AC4E